MKEIVLILISILILIVIFNYKTSKFYFNYKISEFYNTQKIHVVSFAHNCCALAQKNLEQSAMKYGAYRVYSLNLETLEAPEYIKQQILTNKRGAGYWVWKPYCISQILKISDPGDIIIYVDASTYFNKSMKNIVSFINKNSILAFKHENNDNIQSTWTKMDAVNYFGYLSDWCEKEGKQDQFMGAFVGIKNNEIGKKLVALWIDSLNFIKLYDDSPGILKNCHGFQESRHDQQMISLILYKYFNLNFPKYNREMYGWVWHEPINGVSRHN
jgi:hypothetical protein